MQLVSELCCVLEPKPPSGPHASGATHAVLGGVDVGVVVAVAVAVGVVTGCGDEADADGVGVDGVPLPAESDGLVTAPPHATKRNTEKPAVITRFMPYLVRSACHVARVSATYGARQSQRVGAALR